MPDHVIAPCYVETNTSDPANLGRYLLSEGSQLFDIGILFAANINGTPDEPVLSFNSKLQPVLDSGVIQELQSKGIKVTLSILGNHDTAGLATLTSIGVKSFVDQLTKAVNKYGLDGLDFDDEYSNGIPNPSSFIHILSGVRSALPNAILTMYAIGPVMNYLSYDGVDAGDILNYAWNPIYGSFNPPQIPGMEKSSISAAAVDITQTASSTAVNLANRTLSEGYGVFMLYNLIGGDQSVLLSDISQVLYGQTTSYSGS